MSLPVITLTTDFGLADPYVGLMKGVVLGIAPQATIVDLTHGVPAGDILAGALVLDAAVDFFPPGTIHVVVVDPGVGSPRRALAVETDHFILIGPDNGVFTAALQRHAVRRAVELSDSRFHRHPVSSTFHGRDVFAPVAAHLAAGTRVEQLGPAAASPMVLVLPRPIPRGDRMELHVLRIDHFGNLITDLTAGDLAQWTPEAGWDRLVFEAGKAQVTGIRQTFADVPVGQPVAYFGSTGRLELAIRNDNAACAWGLGSGDTISLEHR